MIQEKMYCLSVRTTEPLRIGAKKDPLSGWTLGKPRELRDEVTLGDKWLEGQNYDQESFIKEFILDRLAAIKNIGGYRSKGFGRIEITASAPA